MALPRLLRIEEVSAVTGFPVETLRTWRKRGEGPPFIRMGRRLVCREDDLATWLNNQFPEDGPA